MSRSIRAISSLTYATAQDLADRIRQLPGVGQIYIPQDMNYPSIRMDIDRVHAGELGLSQKDVVDNVITALNSNIMIAPNYWVDYKTGNDYFLSVQYAEHGKPAIHNLVDLKQIPLRAPNVKTADHSRFRGEAGESSIADRNRPLSDSARGGCVRHAGGRGSGQSSALESCRPSRTPSCLPTSASRCAAWSTAWINPSRASGSASAFRSSFCF